MAGALFDAQLQNALSELHKQVWLVELDVDAYIDDNELDVEFSKKIRRGMYDVSPREGEQNDISTTIVKAVDTIETYCLPVLRE